MAKGQGVLETCLDYLCPKNMETKTKIILQWVSLSRKAEFSLQHASKPQVLQLKPKQLLLQRAKAENHGHIINTFLKKKTYCLHVNTTQRN